MSFALPASCLIPPLLTNNALIAVLHRDDATVTDCAATTITLP